MGRKEERCTLNFGTLKNGFHDYSYHLDENFFIDLDQELIKNGEIDVSLSVEKAERHLALSITLKGKVSKKCDVCLSDLAYPIDTVGELMVKITDKPIAEEADLISVGSNETMLPLANHFFDYIALDLPMKIECADSLNRSKCDEEVLKYLNANTEEEGKQKALHPELAKLKDLFKNN
jgi:uncharacterized metal-binding protein YceD (DUF177 family)